MVSKRGAKLVAIGVIVAGTLIAETKKELHFSVGAKAGVSVVNPYGSISVKPSTNNTVVVNAVLHSDKVEVDNNQSGNRVDIQSHLLAGADADSGRVDYEVLVPADASITLHSSTGSLRSNRSPKCHHANHCDRGVGDGRDCDALRTQKSDGVR